MGALGISFRPLKAADLLSVFGVFGGGLSAGPAFRSPGLLLDLRGSFPRRTDQLLELVRGRSG